MVQQRRSSFLIVMENTHQTHSRMIARDDALRLLNRLTTGAALAALAGVGIFAAVSAATLPGTSASANQSATTASGSSSAGSSSSSSASSSFSGLQPSSGLGSVSSGSGMVVSGGSH